MTDRGATASDPARPDKLPPVRFGIRFKLFAAILGLAALTLVAGGVALLVFSETDRAVHRVTEQSLPNVIAALKLAETSAEIAAAAPAIVASASQAERIETREALEQQEAVLGGLVDDIAAAGAAPGAVAALDVEAQRMRVALKRLDAAVARRIELSAARVAAVERMWAIHGQFLDALEPMIDDAVFEMVITGETVTGDTRTAITDLVEVGASQLEQLLTINAEGNLAAGLMAEAAQLDDPAMLAPVRERFIASAGAIEAGLTAVADLPGIADLRAATQTMLAYGRDTSSVFSTNARAPVGLSAAHNAFLLALEPMIDDATFDLVLETERTAASSAEAVSALIDSGASSLQALLTLRAEGNLLAGLLAEVAAAAGENLLPPLEDRVTATSDRLRLLLDERAIETPGGTSGLSPGGPLAAEALRSVTAALAELGTGDRGMFALRAAELDRIAAAERSLAASRSVVVKLREDVAGLVADSQAGSATAAAQSVRMAELGQSVMIIVTALSLAVALGVMFFYVGRRVVEPLTLITRAMTRLAGGDTTVDIPYRERRDELGRMAAALGVFRDTAIEVQESNLAEIREGRRRLSDAIESISEAFSLYDANDRLVVCNRHYWTILHAGQTDVVAPGMTFEEILRRSAEHGQLRPPGEDIEAWIAERLAHHRDPQAPYTYRRGDGRWIMVSERRTEDGGTVAVYSDITELKEREEELASKTRALEQLSAQLSKYLSPQVYESIFTGKQEVKVASQRKKLTVFFSDIASFTETTDRMESEELTHILNHYLTEMARIALAHGATIDKYVGDAILIFFGDPETRGVAADALACVRMAIDMRERMKELQTVWRDGGVEQPLRCRMGINTGYCTVGNFGSEDRMDYTIIGGDVNLAARLEGAAAPGEILLSYETYAHVKNHIACEAQEPISVKGIARPVSTFRVIGAIDPQAAGHLSPVEERLKALDLEVAGMSEADRALTAAALRRAADRLGQD